ncbi:MAG TPA: hypothetical protein VMT16_05795 [Thermoanaerobaculia bacterium]|nr:hypothetical protein [Thermoanaerobaculia bacterium]
MAERSRGEWGARGALQVLALAFLFPVATYLGFRVGAWVGSRIGAPTAGGIVGGLLGAAAGFWELYRVLTASREAGN